MVGKSFVPTDKYNAEKQNTKAQQDALKALQSEFDAFKSSKMTDEEKQAEESRKQAEENKRMRIQLNEMEAKNIFSEAGFKKEDYQDLLSSIVQADSEQTRTLAQNICNSMLRQKEEIEKTIKDKIIKGTKTPPAGNDNDAGSESDLDKYKKLFIEAQKSNDFGKMAYYTRLIQEAQKNNKD